MHIKRLHNWHPIWDKIDLVRERPAGRGILWILFWRGQEYALGKKRDTVLLGRGIACKDDKGRSKFQPLLSHLGKYKKCSKPDRAPSFPVPGAGTPSIPDWYAAVTMMSSHPSCPAQSGLIFLPFSKHLHDWTRECTYHCQGSASPQSPHWSHTLSAK